MLALEVRNVFHMTIKTASAPDQSEAFGILTLAFSVDPMARWSLPDPAKYLEIFSSIAKAFGGRAFAEICNFVCDLFNCE
jgi:hypothetical protein